MKAKSFYTLPNKVVNCWRGLTATKCSFLYWGRPERDWILEWKNLLCQFCSIAEEKKRIDEVALKRALVCWGTAELLYFCLHPVLHFWKCHCFQKLQGEHVPTTGTCFLSDWEQPCSFWLPGAVSEFCVCWSPHVQYDKASADDRYLNTAQIGVWFKCSLPECGNIKQTLSNPWRG